MWSMDVSYRILRENERTGEWEPSDRRSFTVYGDTKEKAEEYARIEYNELLEDYGKRGWDMDDIYGSLEKVPEYETCHEDGDVEER